MTLSMALLIIQLSMLGLNVWCLWQAWRQFRLWCRINDVLQQVVVKAWVMRHAPIWVPWCAVRGLEFEVGMRERVRGSAGPQA